MFNYPIEHSTEKKSVLDFFFLILKVSLEGILTILELIYSGINLRPNLAFSSEFVSHFICIGEKGLSMSTERITSPPLLQFGFSELLAVVNCS